MNKALMIVAAIALSMSVNANAQAYKDMPCPGDLAYYELRGNVKSVILSQWAIIRGHFIQFDVNGVEIMPSAVVRESPQDGKYMMEVLDQSNTEGFGYEKQYSWQGQLKTFFHGYSVDVLKYNDDGSIQSIEVTYEEPYISNIYFRYNEDGYCVSKIEYTREWDQKQEEQSYPCSITLYEYLQYDSQGNWTSRKAVSDQEGKICSSIETREITYYQ